MNPGTPETFAEMRALFDRVDELDPAARERVLERESRERPDIVAAVRRLLARAPGRLAAVEAALIAAHSGVERMAGPYRLERLLGEGGMGEVWLAEQSAPIRRKVAIKMIKAGMDTHQVIARFEAERQALATLSHPTVAAVLDAGETALGRPYFVMEYVDGMPLDRYCQEHELDSRARLRLFLRVCEGVQHAHNRTLVHRDLKPSNILVVADEHAPQPKIIDFGIAKAVSAEAGAGLRLTQVGRPVGTPEYMSPEQLGENEAAVDTRTDVYSLGVTLCELLTGCLPDQRQAGRSALPADLDWIILKAIDPDPERRYESPRALAEDIERFLSARAVTARAPTAAYLLSRFIRRHRVVVATGAGMALSLLFGSGVALLGAHHALEAEHIARQEASAARQALEFVKSMLSAADPGRGGRATVNMLELVEHGARKLESGAIEDPVVVAQLASIIGDIYTKLSAGETGLRWLLVAFEQQSRLLGPEHPDTLKTAEQIAFAYWSYGPVERGLALQESVVDAYRRTQGPSAVSTLRAELMLGRILLRLGEVARAEAMAVDVMDRARNAGRPDSVEALQAGALLAGALHSQERFEAAETVLREVIDGRRKLLGPDHIDVAAGEQMLAGVLVELGRFDEAEALIVQLQAKVLRAFGPGHKAEFRLASNEAFLRRMQGRLEEAAALEQRVLEGFRGMLESGHPDIGLAAQALAETWLALGRQDDAETLLLETLRAEKKSNGRLGPAAGSTFALLERIHRLQGAPHRTAAILEEFEGH